MFILCFEASKVVWHKQPCDRPSNTPGIINGWFTYKPPMKRREHDLNQTSRELCSSRSFLRGLPYSVASCLLKFVRPELKPEELQLAKGAFAMMKLNLPEVCLSCLYFEDGSKIVSLTKRNVVNVMATCCMPFLCVGCCWYGWWWTLIWRIPQRWKLENESKNPWKLTWLAGKFWCSIGNTSSLIHGGFSTVIFFVFVSFRLFSGVSVVGLLQPPSLTTSKVVRRGCEAQEAWCRCLNATSLCSNGRKAGTWEDAWVLVESWSHASIGWMMNTFFRFVR